MGSNPARVACEVFFTDTRKAVCSAKHTSMYGKIKAINIVCFGLLFVIVYSALKSGANQRSWKKIAHKKRMVNLNTW